MRTMTFAALAIGLAGLGGMTRAEDKAKADSTGTCKWTVEFNNQKRDVALKLKLDGGKLTGSMPGRDGAETKLDDGTFKDGEVKFSVTRERNGQKRTSKYSGKLDGDTIKGAITFDRDGKEEKREWEAKRDKDAK